MKNILMIVYYYPPLGGAGVQRSLYYSKYLSIKGYNVCVLTVSNETSTVIDESLEKDGIDKVKIYRAKQKNSNILVNKIINRKSGPATLENSNNVPVKVSKVKLKIRKVLKNFFLYLYRFIYVPDDKTSWKKNAVDLGAKIIKEQNIDIIYSTSAPYTSHLIALKLKKMTNIKWIADFRDPWVKHPFVKYPLVVKKINSVLEKKVIQNSDFVVTVSQPIMDDFINEYPDVNKNKFRVITNGYDEDDFQNLDISYKPSEYVITYNGTLYGKRSPKNFFYAIDNLITNGKIDQKDITIKFIGKTGRDALADINLFMSKYRNIVQLIDYLPHRDSIKQLEQSSALLLIIESGPGSDGIFTGKIFEYIRSGKPIIGIVPDGVARNLINETNTGFCCYPESVKEIETAVLNSYLIWKGESLPLHINWSNIEKYSRENLTNILADIVEEDI